MPNTDEQIDELFDQMLVSARGALVGSGNS